MAGSPCRAAEIKVEARSPHHVNICEHDALLGRGSPSDMPTTSRLATILSADVVGYSHLLGADEQSTLILAATSHLAVAGSGFPGLIRAGEEGVLERLKTLRREIVDPK